MASTITLLRTYLIAEDDAFARHGIEKTLSTFGECVIHGAADGSEARAILERAGAEIDVIISDFHMPGQHGLELLKTVRTGRTAAPHDIPFIMLTGETERSLAGLALSLDVDAFLTKPVKAKALELLLNRLAGGRSAKVTVQKPDAYQGIELSSALL